LAYNGRHLNVLAGSIGLGKNYDAEAGFVPGLAVYPGQTGGVLDTKVKLYPKSQSIVMMVPGVSAEYTFLPDGTLTDKVISANYAINFKNTSQFKAISKKVFQQLPEDFNVLDPRGDSTLLKGQQFSWLEYNMQYSSNTRKIFTYSLTATGGQFYNGKLRGIGGTIGYRFQPYGSASVTFDYSELALPPAYGHARFLLISPRIDLTFSRTLFLTTFVQYNGRYDNVNLNARFQWRFKPASDFFIVYTENYFPGHLASKNRALVLKCTYWINL